MGRLMRGDGEVGVGGEGRRRGLRGLCVNILYFMAPDGTVDKNQTAFDYVIYERILFTKA